jgi:hypothetical protein
MRLLRGESAADQDNHFPRLWDARMSGEGMALDLSEVTEVT